MVPGLEHDISGDGPQVFEEPIRRTPRDDSFAPGEKGEPGGGMEREGEQIEGDQDRRQSFLTVPEIMFEIVSVGFEHVERFVLYLPSGAATGGEFGDAAGGDCQIGDEAVVVRPLALAIQDFDGEPVDDQRVIGGAHRHGGEPAVDRCRSLAPYDSGLAVFLEFGAGEILGDGLMRSRFAGKDEVSAGLLNGGGDGLAGEQIIAQEDWSKAAYRRAVPGKPAFRGVAFAILLLRPILGRDELRRQRQDLLVARRHDAGAQKRVKILRAAVGPLACRTTRAMDFTRTKMLGSIQRDQHPAIQAPEWVESTYRGDRFEEQWIERLRWGAVQHLSDVGVSWNGGHAEQGLAI